MDFETKFRDLVQNIRSVDESERKATIAEIPHLVLQSLKQKNDVLNQLLLVIYNLNTIDSDSYETLNASNRIPVIRHLLRLYTKTIQEHSHQQIAALTEIVDFIHSSELFVELAYALHKCSGNLNKEDTDLVTKTLGLIQDKAAANLYPDALLMIHSINAMK